MTEQYAIDVQRTLHMLEIAVRLLQLTAALTLAGVLYGLWRWHRSKWK